MIRFIKNQTAYLLFIAYLSAKLGYALAGLMEFLNPVEFSRQIILGHVSAPK